jgi:hypothetical protein
MQQPYSPNGDLLAAMFRQDDSLVVTLSQQGEVRVYDSRSGQLLIEPIPAGKDSAVTAFDANENTVAIATATGVTLWPLPPLSVRAPVPDWLLQLATATAGGALDRFAMFRRQPVDAGTFDALRREVAGLPKDAPYVEWGRWLLADPDTRPISPGARATPAAAEGAAKPLSPLRAPRR